VVKVRGQPLSLGWVDRVVWASAFCALGALGRFCAQTGEQIMKQTSASSKNDAYILSCVGNRDLRKTNLPPAVLPRESFIIYSSTINQGPGDSPLRLDHVTVPGQYWLNPVALLDARDQWLSLPYLNLGESFSHDEDPPSSDHQEHGHEEEGRQQPQPIEFALRETPASDEDDTLACTLGRDHGEVIAREEKPERHERRGNTAADADVEKDTQESKDLPRATGADGNTQINVAPDDSAIFTRDIGTQEIYALTLKWP
jgi:hypothetical protein